MTVILSASGVETTALDMIKKALRLIGAIGRNDPVTSQEATDHWSTLNSMLESWSIERLMVYQIYEETLTWASGQSSRTIGSGGNFDTTRPTRIANGFSRISNIDYPYVVISKEEYDAIADKTTQSSYPDYIYYAPSMSLGTLYAYPVPSASLAFHLNSWKQLQAFTGTTTPLSLPQGYQRAIEYNLAIEIQGEYPDLVLPESVVKIARESKAAIKTINSPVILAELGMSAGRRYNIYSDS